MTKTHRDIQKQILEPDVDGRYLHLVICLIPMVMMVKSNTTKTMAALKATTTKVCLFLFMHELTLIGGSRQSVEPPL